MPTEMSHLVGDLSLFQSRESGLPRRHQRHADGVLDRGRAMAAARPTARGRSTQLLSVAARVAATNRRDTPSSGAPVIRAANSADRSPAKIRCVWLSAKPGTMVPATADRAIGGGGFGGRAEPDDLAVLVDQGSTNVAEGRLGRLAGAVTAVTTKFGDIDDPTDEPVAVGVPAGRGDIARRAPKKSLGCATERGGGSSRDGSPSGGAHRERRTRRRPARRSSSPVAEKMIWSAREPTVRIESRRTATRSA